MGPIAKGLAAAELARRLNPRYPRWYSYYEARTLFFLWRYEDVVAKPQYRMTGEPTWHCRDMLLSAAFGLLGRAEPAQQCAKWFLGGVRNAWRGDPNTGSPDYVDWFVDLLPEPGVIQAITLREGIVGVHSIIRNACKPSPARYLGDDGRCISCDGQINDAALENGIEDRLMEKCFTGGNLASRMKQCQPR